MTKKQVFAKVEGLGYGVAENIRCSWTGKHVRYQTYAINHGGGGAQSFKTMAAINRWADQVIETRRMCGYE